MNLRQVLFCLIGVLSLAVCSFAQERRLAIGQGGSESYQFFYDMVVTPGEPPVRSLGGGIRVGSQIHRVMIDKENRSYFGYTATVEVVSAPGPYRITFGPLTGGPQNFLSEGENAAAYTQLAAPDWGGPAIRTIRAGEVIALTLLTNNRTGQKIVEYVTVMPPGESPDRLGPLPMKSIFEEGTPRDFRAEDALLDVRPSSATLSGVAVRLPGGASGILPYFSVPNHGRLILSLTPRPDLGFRKAGEIRGSTMSITFDGRTLNVNNEGRIAPGAGPFNLYVLHQRDWPLTGTGVVSAQQLAEPQAFRIRGRVDGTIPAGQAQGAVVFDRIGGGAADRRTPVNVAADGSFEASGLRPGTYEIYLLGRVRATVVLSDKDVTDLVVRPAR
jgi:hypothetical protein